MTPRGWSSDVVLYVPGLERALWELRVAPDVDSHKDTKSYNCMELNSANTRKNRK